MKFKLANLLFAGSRFLVQYPLLCYRADKGLAFPSPDGSLGISEQSRIDFTTYFNALSVKKWRSYTNVRSFYLHFEYSGQIFRLTQTKCNNLDWDSSKVEASEMSFGQSSEWTNVDIKMADIPDAILQAFRLETEGKLRIRNAYYYCEIDAAEIRPVELSVASTTFRKEGYVLKNISLIENQILKSEEPIAQHFTLHIIDNGRTLKSDASSSNRVLIHPNPNVGGSGGFARGMIESLEQEPKATHVLLMDDDVEVLPESFIRTFNLLSLVKDEFAVTFLSGAMMSLEEPNLRTEDLGFFTQKGTFSPLKPAGYMTSLHDVIETEIYRAPSELYGDTIQQYAGWWYCVIPTAVIEQYGLPLPLFVRSDDAEYALRCHANFMTMNGVCVWHNAFKYKYSAAVERYQVSRNTLVSQATTGVAPLSDFLYEIRREVQLDLKKFNYADAALAVKGLEDFLRGPEWLSHPVAESRFMDANREKEKLIPIEELIPEAAELGVDLTQLAQGNLSLDGDRSKFQALKDYFTVNGQRFFNESANRKGKVAVIDAAGWVYPAGKIRNVDTLIVVDMPNKKGAIRHMDPKRFKEVWTRYLKAEKEFKKNRSTLYRRYASFRDEFTSISFWKNYLKEASNS